MNSRTGKIGIIGRVDLGRTLFDGQTVKTRMMYQLLCEMYGADRIEIVDTIDWRHRALKIVVDTRRCLKHCDDVVILLSRNGRRVLYPLLAKAAKKRGTRVYQNLIGGWLDGDLEQFPEWVGYLNAFEVNWVESHKLVEAVAAKGVSNASFMPNFKYLEVPSALEDRAYGNPWRFCCFSRVVKEKGVGDAVRAIEELNSLGDGRAYQLDVYGPLDAGYRGEFEALVGQCAHCRYLGSVEPEASVETVMGYDALLFPTKWQKEGIPGTIIDALSAGVPVIGSHWMYYEELLADGETGFGYEFGHNELLKDAILKFVDLSDVERNQMRRECLRRAKLYTPEAVTGQVREAIGQ